MNIRIVFISCVLVFCSLPIEAKRKAKPRAGEGVYRFLINNGLHPSRDYDAFIALNRKRLGKNNCLIRDIEYVLPPLPATTETTAKKSRPGYEPLFGEKYDSYTITSDRLKGATFYLSSGHGGPDCGAIGVVDGREIHEDEYAYDIMLRLARNLLREGATVHIIIRDKNDGIRDERFLKSNRKETCMGRDIPLNQRDRLQQRCDAIDRLDRQVTTAYRRAVFIHLDSHSARRQVDVFFYHHSKSREGRNCGNVLRRTFREQYQKHQPGRGFTGTVSPRNLYVLSNCRVVGLFAELGNIRNSFDQRRFLEVSNRQALANWMCRGFIADYEQAKGASTR
jgi:N-acetylmuramoyl-L-alanine amidase